MSPSGPESRSAWRHYKVTWAWGSSSVPASLAGIRCTSLSCSLGAGAWKNRWENDASLTTRMMTCPLSPDPGGLLPTSRKWRQANLSACEKDKITRLSTVLHMHHTASKPGLVTQTKQLQKVTVFNPFTLKFSDALQIIQEGNIYSKNLWDH